MDKTDYVDIFVDEALENLQALNQAMLEMEKGGCTADGLGEAYRIMHTLKGNANVLGFEAIGELAHSMEDLFETLRGGGGNPEKAVWGLLFEGLDLAEAMVRDISEAGAIKTEKPDVLARLRASAASLAGERKKRGGAGAAAPKAAGGGARGSAAGPLAGERAFEIRLMLAKDARFKAGRVFQLLKRLSGMGRVTGTTPDVDELEDSVLEVTIGFASGEPEDRIRDAALEITGVERVAVKASGASSAAPEAKGEPRGGQMPGPAEAADTVRIKSRHLDHLLDLVGEIMISNIRVNQMARGVEDRELAQTLSNNERLIGELQDTVLRMRMVPVDHIFKRFPRLVRDLASGQDKKIDFRIVGNTIEIDRGLLDGIGDALVHALRNAVDHGIEPAEERLAAGKGAAGTICLSACKEQSGIVVTVEDDGRGINESRLVECAVAKKLISQEEAKKAGGETAVALAFLPGVSTADRVTEISGRGVGLDAVKTKIESLGGTVRLESKAGAGTKLTIRLPPSMSIIRAMLVGINGENYVIPLENVKETTRVPLQEVHGFAGKGMFRLRDEVLPLVNLHGTFGGELSELKGSMPVLVVEKDGKRAALVVTKFLGQQDIVVKNVGGDIRRAPCFTGATILGDGKVALIIDVGALI